MIWKIGLMSITAMTAVIDTNVLLAIISKRSIFRWIFDCIINGRIQLCVSTEILLEYKEILARKTNTQVADNILEFVLFNPYVRQYEIFYRFNLIEFDTSDNKFVDCAIAADADVLLSNDKHFQILKQVDFPKVSVLTIDEFAGLYKAALV